MSTLSPSRRRHPSRTTRKFQRNIILLITLIFSFLTLLFLSYHPESSTAETIDHYLSTTKQAWKGGIKGWKDGDWGVWKDTGGWSGDDELIIGENDGCAGWDHEGREEDDPENCLMARQYRQVARVLAREEKAEHPHWYFTLDHNKAALRHLLRCFTPPSHPDHLSCPPKPLALCGWWYCAEVITHATTGEVVWMSSVMSQLKSLGLEFIAVGPHENWIEVAEMMPDVYRFIWNSDLDTITCLTDPRCVAKEHYVPPVDAEDLSVGIPDEERGIIPLWALNVVDYWGARPKEISNNDYWWGLTQNGDWSFQPLGQQWIATPWPLPGHVHLPYSIEEYCLSIPFQPHSTRNDTVLIFAKKSAYFDYHYVSPKTYWTNLSHDPSFELLLTATEEEGHPLPEGLSTLGGQTREAYEELVGGVKVLLGMGAPNISPSVYTALCQGTPVVIPYFVESHRTDGWYRYSGFSQHGPASMIGPPYVYSYYSNNYTQLVEVVHQALDTPIERYIPDDMKLDYAIGQLEAYIARDLKGMFDEVLRENDGQIPRLIKGARERCYELKRCRDMLPAGRIPSILGQIHGD